MSAGGDDDDGGDQPLRDAKGRMLRPLPGSAPRWKPGEHGGGRGRPAPEREVTIEARKLSIEAMRQLAAVMRDRKAQAIARVRAIEIILERGFGKAPQRVQIEGDAAAMSNPVLERWLKRQLATLTIDGQADEVDEDPDGNEVGDDDP